MDVSIKESSKMIRYKVKGSLFGLMIKYMKVNGGIIVYQDMEFSKKGIKHIKVI